MRAYTHGGWVHRQRVSATYLTRKKLVHFSYAPDGAQTRVTDVMESRESDALPIEPLRHRDDYSFLLSLAAGTHFTLDALFPVC